MHREVPCGIRETDECLLAEQQRQQLIKRATSLDICDYLRNIVDFVVGVLFDSDRHMQRLMLNGSRNAFFCGEKTYGIRLGTNFS